MKAKKNVQVGDVVQFPFYQFAPLRKGWNGWLFRAGIVEKLYISQSGNQCAKVRYCVKRASRYQLLPCEEATINIVCKNLFEYNLAFKVEMIHEFLEAEKAGEQVCWDEDAALLVNRGLA